MATNSQSDESVPTAEHAEIDRCLVCGTTEALSSSSLELRAWDGRWLATSLPVCDDCAADIEEVTR